MIGYYNYTVILTYIGTICGFVGITKVWEHDLKAALLCLMLAGFCDMFDGKIASTRTRTVPEKKFGIQIDSLSDLICFGALPALLVYHFSNESTLCLVISAGYLLCALIRLAYYNVDEDQRQNQETTARKTYLGLPVTGAALLLPFFMGISLHMDFPIEAFAPWLLLAIAVAFITPFSIKKPGNIGKMVILAVGVLALSLVILG